MISTQTICVCSPGIPLLGTCLKSQVSLSPLRRRGGRKWSSDFQKGRGDNTLAIKQAPSFFSSAEDASADEVPAKDTSVRKFTGTKTMELMDQISPFKLASTVND